MSQPAALQQHRLGWRPLKKILTHDERPGYHQSRRSSKPRIFKWLRDEHGYAGGETLAKHALRDWKHRHHQVIRSLSHPPEEAQVDIGEATITLAGQPTKVAMFVLTLPNSGAIFVQAFPRECTETFL